MRKLIEQYLTAHKKAGIENPDWIKNGPVQDVKVTEDRIDIRIDGPIDEFVGIDITEIINVIEENPGKDIKVKITTPGGSLFDGLQLYGALSERAKTNTVEITGNGLVASAGALIFLAADKDKRFLNDGTMIMFHGTQAATIIIGNKDAIKDEAKRIYDVMRSTDENLKGILLDKTDVSEETADEWIGNQKYLSKSEAINYGIATKDKTEEPKAKVEIDNEAITSYLNFVKDNYYKEKLNV